MHRWLDRLAFIIFGQRADGAGDANNVAGNGGWGGGNQVPPFVPYSMYWEDERREQERERRRRERRRNERRKEQA